MQSALVKADRSRSVLPDPELSSDHAAVAAIKTALGLLDNGRHPEALAYLDGLRPIEVGNPAACALAGLICISLKANRRALAWLDRAIALGGADSAILGHRAGVLAAIGDHRQALASYEAAVEAGSLDPILHYNRANLLRQAGRLSEAVASYDVALHLQPAFPDALRAGGTVLRDLGHAEGALRFFDEALRLRTDDLDTWLDRTNLLQSQHRYEEALADYDRALVYLPGNAQLLTNRGTALNELGRLDEACDSFDAALTEDADLPQAHLNRGNTMVWLGRPGEALEAFDRALALQRPYPEASSGRGLALKLLCRFDDAALSFEEALARDHDFAYARANRGELRLLQGDFERGWPDYEFRFLAGRQDRQILKAAVPFWTGEPCSGKRLVVFADQGNGDKIHFVRFLPALAATGAIVTVVCPARLQRLFAGLTAGLRVVDAVEDGETFDLQIGLSSLPACLKITIDTIPAADGYLSADPGRVTQWAERLGRTGLKIGLCWRGSQKWQIDPRRSVPLAAFAPLAALPDVRLISLQLPEDNEAAGSTFTALHIEALGDDLDAGPDAFVDTAAVIANLDLVITCDTCIAHLAGALGRPVWVMLQASAEWRWLLETDKSPWYASMRLFRQNQPGAWDEPVDVLARAVAQWARAWRAHQNATEVAKALYVPVPIGDIVDKMTILSIKRERIRDESKRENVRREFELLEQTISNALPTVDPRFEALAKELGEVNEALWTIEDDIRDCELRRDFGETFVALARSVYHTNDRRAALKREINLAFGSQLIEEKDYRGSSDRRVANRRAGDGAVARQR